MKLLALLKMNLSNGDEGNLENCVTSRGVSVGAGLPGGSLVVPLGDQLQNVLHAVHLEWEVMIMIMVMTLILIVGLMKRYDTDHPRCPPWMGDDDYDHDD